MTYEVAKHYITKVLLEEGPPSGGVAPPARVTHCTDATEDGATTEGQGRQVHARAPTTLHQRLLHSVVIKSNTGYFMRPIRTSQLVLHYLTMNL